ncbi:glycosyltransferase family 2 protein [Candidatus Pacearchaeota archaeon]|jgi:biofilm PGA synthesis N-glycosyltransferase PgaC|nr:glycosyltransferase family 2 protein [Candidatus Pacearchaeota archaeon]
MDTITVIYLIYIFIGFYFLFLFILIYIQNKNYLYYSPKPKRDYSLSIVIPCYNEGATIEKTVKSVLDSGYKNLKKVIVVDDCSKDNSYKIIKELEKKYPKVLAVQTPKNTGCAAGSKNYGAKFVDTELIGFSDGDSFIEKGSIDKLVGFFNDEKMGSVTCSVLVANRDKFIERVQSVEYKVIKFSRKLLEFIDSIYVTPGPLGVFRKSAFDKIGGFDEKNLTEDIEITWHLQAEGYKVRMALLSRAYTVAPSTIKDWVKQRNRWNIGGLQTSIKYGRDWFRKGMLGKFILPFFVFSWVIGLFGLTVLAYRILKVLIFRLFSTTYSIQTQTSLIRFEDISLMPNILIFFGLVMFFLSMWFTLLSLFHMKDENRKGENFFVLSFYMVFYVMIYPIILISSFYKFLKGHRKW